MFRIADIQVSRNIQERRLDRMSGVAVIDDMDPLLGIIQIDIGTFDIDLAGLARPVSPDHR